MILQAYGFVDATPIQLSEALKELHMSHSLIGGFGRIMRLELDGLSESQPVWPVIVDRVRTIPKIDFDRDPMVLLVVDGRASLAVSNVSDATLPEKRTTRNLRDTLIHALTDSTKHPGWSLTRNEPTLSEFVGLAVKPSLLNLVQGSIYKIHPYALRKEVQRTCIAYLAGAVGIQAMRRYLKSSLKFQPLLELIDSPKGTNLREAIAAFNAGRPMEAVCSEFGVESFEILYLVKSNGQVKGS
jgi:hypothetical protein